MSVVSFSDGMCLEVESKAEDEDRGNDQEWPADAGGEDSKNSGDPADHHEECGAHVYSGAVIPTGASLNLYKAVASSVYTFYQVSVVEGLFSSRSAQRIVRLLREGGTKHSALGLVRSLRGVPRDVVVEFVSHVGDDLNGVAANETCVCAS